MEYGLACMVGRSSRESIENQWNILYIYSFNGFACLLEGYVEVEDVRWMVERGMASAYIIIYLVVCLQ